MKAVGLNIKCWAQHKVVGLSIKLLGIAYKVLGSSALQVLRMPFKELPFCDEELPGKKVVEELSRALFYFFLPGNSFRKKQ